MTQFDPRGDDVRTSDANPGNSDNLLKLYIEPTSTCNLACTMCFRNSWIGEDFADMDFSVFEKNHGDHAGER